MAMPWFVYVARCKDGSFYTGIAIDVAKRIAQHDAGKGARYTRGRGPLMLLAKRRCETQGAALRLELAVKRLSHDEKELLSRGRHRFRALYLSASSPAGSAQQRKPVE